MRHPAWCAALLPLMASIGCRSEPPPAPASAPAAVAATSARKLVIDPTLLTSGRVSFVVAERRAPTEELKFPGEVRASLGAAEVGALVSGRIAAVSAVEGAHVSRGQVLAWLDAPEVARATAELLRAKARESSAKKKLERQLQLEAEQATSKSALDDARTEAEVTRADLLAARTLLRSLGGTEPSDAADGAEASLSARVALRAPVAGVVVRREAVLGAAVTPERTLFWLSGEAPAFVTARVPEGAQVPADGEEARLDTRVSKLACKAWVRGAPGVVNRETRSMDVRLEPESSCLGLIPGAYVDVTFARPGRHEAQGLVVPREAIVEVHGASVAFVVSAMPGEVSVRTLRVSQQLGAETVIEAGVEVGERVVSHGALLLKGELLRAELTGG